MLPGALQAVIKIYNNKTGQFAEANRSVGPWPIRSLALSFPGPLTPWNFRCLGHADDAKIYRENTRPREVS